MAKVQRLSERRLPLRREDKHQSSTTSSPFDDIPFEIIGQIFVFCCHATSRNGLAQNATVFQEVSTICSVSKRWRLIALAVPELWGVLEVSIGSYSSSPSLPVLSSWLERSGTHPLFLSLIFEASGSSRSVDSIMVFDIILAQIYRWKSVSFTFNGPVRDMPSFVEVQAPMLEAVEFNLNCNYGLAGLLDAKIFYSLVRLCSSPTLRSYTCRGGFQPLKTAQQVSPIPYHQLTCIRMEASMIDDDTLFSILGEATRLLECHVHGIFKTQTLLPSSNRQVSSNIHTLSLHGDIPNLLQSLIVPSLANFGIRFKTPFITSWSNEAFAMCLARSLCQITSFTIRNLALNAQQLHDCLRLLSPTLIHLNILSDRLDPSGYNAIENLKEELLKDLTYDGSSSDTLCPWLESIAFERCFDPNLQQGLLSKLVASRWKGGCSLVQFSHSDALHQVAPLKRFSVVFRYHTHSLDAIQLKNMFKEGLEGAVEFGIPAKRN